MGIQFLEEMKPLCEIPPHHRKPEKKSQLIEKVLWTAITITVVILCFQIPLFAIMTSDSPDSPHWMKTIMEGSGQGSALVKRAISSPIVTSSHIMQLLTDTKIIGSGDTAKDETHHHPNVNPPKYSDSDGNLDLIPGSNGTKEVDDGDWSRLRYHLKHAIGSPGKLLKTGKGDLPASDPLDLSSLWLVFDDSKGYLNASLHNVKVHGLSRLFLKDTAFNEGTKELSILFSVPSLSVTGDYSIAHRRGDNLVDDNGKLTLGLHHWYTTWFSRVISFNSTTEELTVGRISVKSYFDSCTKEFTSSSGYIGKDLTAYSHTIETISSMLSNKVQSEVDERLNLLLSQYMNEEPTTLTDVLRIAARWKDAKPLGSAESEGSLSRTKRQVPCETGDELDEYVDSLFRFASRIVRAMEPIGLPNATVELPGLNLKLFLYKGGASRAYSLQRKKSAWVFCTNESISLGLTVGFNDLRVKYRYRAIFDWNLLFDGELEANLQGTKAQVQFTQTTPDDDSEEEVQQRVDRVRIWRLGKVRVILKGLGNLTQAVSMLLTRTLNNNQEQLDPTIRRLESEAVVAVNEMLKNITVPFFSIV